MKKLQKKQKLDFHFQCFLLAYFPGDNLKP